LKRVMVLGGFCYPEYAEQVVLKFFGCLKKTLPRSKKTKLYNLLPDVLKELWERAERDRRFTSTSDDWIGAFQKAGEFPYRAAAERAIKVVFSSMKELMHAQQVKELIELMPTSLRELVKDSSACVYDSSAEEFL